MVGTFQDDERENAMCALFELIKDENEGRSGVDAFLDLQGKLVPFELKTTSNGSVTTVRDFGPDHIEKWRGKHWLIGFFIDGEEYYHYGTPTMMAAWIAEKASYIKPDFMLAGIASSNLGRGDMFKVMEEKEVYSYDDARALHKRQYSRQKYLDLQDVDSGYSQDRMLEIFQDRARYLVERGSTLNNPHIPKSYFGGWVKITEHHASTLKTMVQKYLGSL